MFWKIRWMDEAGSFAEEGLQGEGRFVLQRHRDEGGEHLDLRLEQEGFLEGWRIDATDLDEERWATRKGPHPTRWLSEDGDAHREDEGVYAWADFGAKGGTLLLEGRDGCRRLSIVRQKEIRPADLREVLQILAVCDAELADAAGLIADGATARTRAIERLCGLGSEMDGSAFDEAVWRKSLSRLSLEDIYAQLRAFEVRFDLVHPPERVSQAEGLASQDGIGRTDRAMSILRD